MANIKISDLPTAGPLTGDELILMSQGGVDVTMPLSFAATRIIGVAIEEGEKTHTRIDAAGNTLAGSEYNLGGSYYDGHAAFALTDQTIDGQAMVRVPRFWYRRAPITSGTHNGKEGWWISAWPAPGFVLHPAFYDDGDPVDCFWVGKYQGGDDGGGGVKVSSEPGVLPLASINIGTYRDRCAARNTGGVTGFMLWSIYQLAAIQMLAMIEMGSTDSQASIGNGRVNEASAANTDAADVAQATYRGIVGLWGNIMQFIDGLRTDANPSGPGEFELWDRTGGKAWVATGIARVAMTGVGPLTMLADAGASHDFRDVFVGNENAVNAAASTWPDYLYHRDLGGRIYLHGGYWNYGSNAGLWTINGSYGATSSRTDIGGRLAKV